MDDDIWVIIGLATLLTYVGRTGGHLVLARFKTISPRVEAGLDAIPVAVLITIVTPVLISGGWVERMVVVVCALLALRLPLIVTVFAGCAMTALARAAGF